MDNREKIPSRMNDGLLKAVLEDNFPDFLRFLYPDAEARFDLEKEVEFMNSELDAITLNREEKTNRRVCGSARKGFSAGRNGKMDLRAHGNRGRAGR